ncbi:MAG: dihydroneopterin aldolase family protein [Halobacteriales archaeon]|nr:dihydroneopterin aldolase family protein [Halobacteriales archaeon]
MKPTETEIACFESGVKLGSLYHQFSGTPISLSSIESLSSAIEKSILNQPHCTNVSVEISEEAVEKSMNDDFGYAELKGDMMAVRIKIQYKDTEVVSKMRVERDYPLMFVDSVETKG